MAAAAPRQLYKLSPEAEREALEAIADLECGRYIDLTPEQMEAWGRTGEMPWLDEFPD